MSYIQERLASTMGKWQTAMKTREMGWPDELQNLVRKSWKVVDPCAQMIGCQSQLLTTEIKLVP